MALSLEVIHHPCVDVIWHIELKDFLRLDAVECLCKIDRDDGHVFVQAQHRPYTLSSAANRSLQRM